MGLVTHGDRIIACCRRTEGVYVGTVPCSAASPGAWSRGGAVTGRESVRGGIGPGVEVVPEACDVGGRHGRLSTLVAPLRPLGRVAPGEESGSRPRCCSRAARTQIRASTRKRSSERWGGMLETRDLELRVRQSSVPVWILNGMRL